MICFELIQFLLNYFIAPTRLSMEGPCCLPSSPLLHHVHGFGCKKFCSSPAFIQT